MSEDEPIKEFLRFTSEGEIIRLAEIGLAVEMHQAAERFFCGRTDVAYTRETAAKLQAYLELNPGCVNGWDDPNDFSWWKDAFKILKPPSGA